MARYDSMRGRFGRGPYDKPFRRSEGVGGESDAGFRQWETEFEAPAGDAASLRGALYGPSRYGLGPYHERLRKRRKADDALRDEIEEALFYDTWIDAEAITVEVKDGVVTLRGTLPNFEEVRYATDDAWDVDGVVGVQSELSVESR